MIERMNLGGTPFVGIVSFTTEDITITRTGLSENKIRKISATLGTKVLQCSAARTDLVGIFLAGNSKGVLIPYILEEHEREVIESKLACETMVVPTKFTALGNMLLVNDKGGIINPELGYLREEIESFLEVEIEEGIIAGFKNVGSVAVANNKGCLVHQQTSEEKMEWIKDVLKVPVSHSTANRGVGFLGGCMIANSRGVVVGESSTGPELGRIDDILMEE
ncbi:MAG: translation initiation factor IF-6 [Candidatus Methanofastidiosia archaeon]